MDGCPSRTLEKAHGSHSNHRRALRTECPCGCPSTSQKVLAGKAGVGGAENPSPREGRGCNRRTHHCHCVGPCLQAQKAQGPEPVSYSGGRGAGLREVRDPRASGGLVQPGGSLGSAAVQGAEEAAVLVLTSCWVSGLITE